jgi:hypothetical protein
MLEAPWKVTAAARLGSSRMFGSKIDRKIIDIRANA